MSVVAAGDHNEGHADSCACLRPGDRECNCHLAYGFATAEAMQEADEAERSVYSGDLPGHKTMPGFITPERVAALHTAIGHKGGDDPTPTGADHDGQR